MYRSAIDPIGLPTITIFSHHMSSVRSYDVRPSVPIFKILQNNFQVRKIVIATGWTLVQAEGIIDDPCLVKFCFQYWHDTAIPF